ncbi:hypothetical protein B0H13DRAFT_1912604 [Mycena leptocephala]|nr:hypothetical protein B0H13DRAFT_1912604 [Mycena leptocephala]
MGTDLRNARTHAYGVQDTVAAGWEGSGILRRSPTRPALMREVRKQWRLAERMGCRVIRGQRRTSPLPSCSVEVADLEHQHPHQGCPFPVASDNCQKIFKPSGIGLEQKIPRNVGLQVQHYLVVEDFGNVWPAGNLALNPLRSSETC